MTTGVRCGHRDDGSVEASCLPPVAGRRSPSVSLLILRPRHRAPRTNTPDQIVGRFNFKFQVLGRVLRGLRHPGDVELQERGGLAREGGGPTGDGEGVDHQLGRARRGVPGVPLRVNNVDADGAVAVAGGGEWLVKAPMIDDPFFVSCGLGDPFPMHPMHIVPGLSRITTYMPTRSRYSGLSLPNFEC